MSRIQQPRELAELKGATRKNPQRYTKTVPKAGFALGLPPDHMADDAKAVWFELETYALQGVLTCAERPVFETLATLFAQFRRDPDGFPANKLGHLISCLARLGMTPADRQKLGTDGPKEDNPFNAF